MSNAASWAVSAGNKFREIARTTENPSTKLLAEGLTHLAEGVRELDAQIETLRKEVRDVSQAASTTNQ
jgi:hypothetical protein